MAEQKFEYYEGVAIYYSILADRWYAQTFTPQVAHDLTRAELRLRRNANNLGNMTLSLRLTSASLPTGGDLVSKALDSDIIPYDGSFHIISFDLPYAGLQVDTMYALVFRCPGADASDEMRWSATGAGAYARGNYCRSDDAGSNWDNYDPTDGYFAEYGEIPSAGAPGAGQAAVLVGLGSI